MRRYSSCLAPSFDAIRRVSGHRHRAMAWRVARLSRRMPSSAGDGFAVSFWSGHDNGCAGITETRQTPQIRATRKRGHEVGRGRKPPSNRPKTPKFGLPRQYHGVEKTDLEKCDKVLPRGLCSMARGRTPPNRQSFRGCPNVIFPCRLGGCKGRFLGTIRCFWKRSRVSLKRAKSHAKGQLFAEFSGLCGLYPWACYLETRSDLFSSALLSGLSPK